MTGLDYINSNNTNYINKEYSFFEKGREKLKNTKNRHLIVLNDLFSM